MHESNTKCRLLCIFWFWCFFGYVSSLYNIEYGDQFALSYRQKIIISVNLFFGIFYLIPLLYGFLVLAILLCASCFVIHSINYYWHGGVGIDYSTQDKLVIYTMAASGFLVAGLTVFVVFLADISVCEIHGYTGCVESRLSISQYWKQTQNSSQGIIRFITYMFTGVWVHFSIAKIFAFCFNQCSECT